MPEICSVSTEPSPHITLESLERALHEVRDVLSSAVIHKVPTIMCVTHQNDQGPVACSIHPIISWADERCERGQKGLIHGVPFHNTRHAKWLLWLQHENPAEMERRRAEYWK